MKRSDFENFLVNIIREARCDEGDLTHFDYANQIIDGIEQYGYCVPPYLAEDEHLIKVSSYLQGPFCWEPENG